MKKLEILLKYRFRYFLISLALTNFILIINDPLYVLFGIPFAIYILHLHKDLVLPIIVVLILYSFFLILFDMQEMTVSDEYDVTVLNSINHKTNTSFVGKINGQKIMVYLDNLDLTILPGDKITCKGKIEKPNNNTIPGTFNYKMYLKSKKIKNVLYVESYNITSHTFSIEIIRHEIMMYINDNMPLSSRYIRTFVLADKSLFEQEFKDKISFLGISHLFAVSGLHIGLLVMVLNNIYIKIYPDSERSYKLIIPILIVYVVITSFSPSIVRASLMYAGYTVKKIFKLNISALDILSVIYIVLLLSNPYFYHNTGFTLSFMVTFSILMGQFTLKNENKIQQILMITVLAFCASFPLIISLNHEINLYTLLLNIVFVLYMTYVILPGGYITFIFPFFDSLYNSVIKPFEYLIVVFSDISILNISFAFINKLQIMIFYYFIICLFRNISKKSQFYNTLIAFFIFMILSYNVNTFNPISSVNMIDVYGDSIFIQDQFDQCNILVDTGDKDDYNSVISYIKNRNIRRIDYLILTHPHDDHIGEANDVYKEFDVVNIIDSKTEIQGKSISCGSIILEFYEFEQNYLDKNNQSVIFSLFIQDKHYLFTGDMEEVKEMEFIRNYDIDIDYLKSGHHGSITSSSVEFIKAIDAENVLISCYRSNLHGHPHEEIINRYEVEEMNIFRTDLLGTIEIKYIFGNEYKKYHKP